MLVVVGGWADVCVCVWRRGGGGDRLTDRGLVGPRGRSEGPWHMKAYAETVGGW